MLLCVLLVALYASFLWALHQRKLPVVVMRATFTISLLIAVILSWAACHVINLLATAKCFGVSTANSLCRVACAFTFRYAFRFNCPHIHICLMEGSLPWSDITGRNALCLCHTSFFDTLLFLWLVPFKYIYAIKTFVKASLRKLPLFGYVITACGHFPVYFTSEESSSFSVNKEKQAAVAQDVEQFVKRGGSLSFFPEGSLNRHPETLKAFRYGSFNTIVEHKLPIYYMVTYGNSEVWSSTLKGMPGFPADIYMYIGKYEYDTSAADAVALSTQLHDVMQKKLDEMIALRASRGYKPWYTPAHVE